MFVKDNSIESAKSYFQERLTLLFSESEIKSMWKQLICKRFEWSNTDFLLAKDFKLSESDLLYVRSFVKRLQSNEPFQYILGETSFYNLTIQCDKRALIPRPETEELVSWIAETNSPAKILDICSGSGCIALALKSVFKNSFVFGLDISIDANELAKSNALKNKLDVTFELVDALNSSHFFWNSVSEIDVIVSNPPYIAHYEKAEMSQNVLKYEPHLALFVEHESPIIFYERIAELACLKLNKKGHLFFELNPLYSQQIQEIVSEIGFVNIELRKDLQGKTRMLKAQKA
jgi:release factor glutamine methyltransferase